MSSLTQTLIPPSQRQPVEALNDALDLSYGDTLSKRTGFLIMLTLAGMIAIAGVLDRLDGDRHRRHDHRAAGHADPRDRARHRHGPPEPRAALDHVGADRRS